MRPVGRCFNNNHKQPKWTGFFFSIILLYINSISVFIKASKDKMCGVKMAIFSDISNALWQRGYSLIWLHIQRNKHPATGIFVFMHHSRNTQERTAIICSAKVEEQAKMWFYCTNSSCLFTPNVMRLYYKSLPLFVYFVLPVSLFCFLIMFPVQAMPLIWEGGHSFVQSLKGGCEVYTSWSCLSLVTSFLVAVDEAASESSQAVPFFK